MSTIVPDPTYGLSLDPATAEALIHFSRRRRVLLFVRAIAAGLVALFAMMLVVALCDYVWFLSDSVRWLMSVVGYGLVLATMWWQGLGRLNESDPKRLARQLESAEPRLREDLLSAVELADPDLINGSAGFRARLQKRVAHRLAGIDISSLLPVGLVRRWLSTGLLAITICIVLLLIPQMQFGRRIARAMLPGFAIQRASLTEVTIIKPSPATGYVAEGDAVAVVVRVTGADVQEVMLRWRTDEGVEGETEMTPRVGPPSAAADGTLHHDDLYAANLSIGSVAMDYQVFAGDAITLWNTLTPLPRPRVASFEKRYIFPDYAKLEDRVEQEEHGDLKALVGSAAEVTIRFDEPVDHAVLRFSNLGAEVPLEAIDGSKTDYITSVTIKTPGQYQIDATSTHSGLNNPFSPQYTITPVLDSPPVVRWSPTQPNSSLVSPLDVVSLAATANDDLPFDRVIQEFIINSNPMRQREISIGESSREIKFQWDWDLMNRSEEESQTVKLTSGDIVRTRAVGVDRRGNRGESRWIELLVTDEGFDAGRHAPLERLAALASKVAQWTNQANSLSKQIVMLKDADQKVDFDSIQQEADQLHDAKDSLIAEFKSVIESSQAVALAGTLELSGRALLDVDQRFVEILSRWADVRTLDHPAWQRSRDQALREIVNDANRFGQQSLRLDQLTRSAFGEQLAVGLVSDGMALQRSLRPLLDEEKKMPADRFPRYLMVAIGRLEAINSLMRNFEDALPDSTRRHFEGWHRWAEPWSDRLTSSIQAGTDEAAHRRLVKQFDGELSNQVNNAIVDGHLASTLNNMSREIPNEIGPTSDKVRRLTTFGELSRVATERADKEEDSDKVAGFQRDIKLADADWNRSLSTLRGRLEQEEALHRSRPFADLQYAADMKLMNRAIENVTQNGYQPYREERPAEIHTKLANAFLLLEAKHHADSWLAEIGTLLDAERRLESPAQAKILHGSCLERYSVGMEWPVRQLRSLQIPAEEVDPIERLRHSADYNEARQRITSRRWSKEELLTADAPLSSLQRELSTALAALEPRATEARETIQQYVLTLAEQARDAAEKAKEAQERTESRENADQETAEQLAEQQQQAEQAAMKTVETLVDMANTAQITDQAERDLARDADAAAAQIQDAVQRAQEEMKEATSLENQQDRSEALDRTAEALEDLSSALEQTANHFEKAEKGEDIAESREQLRQAEEALQIQNDMQERYDQAEEMAAAAQSDPKELMEQLERELQTNEPMQQELSEIAQRAAEAAQRTLQQAAREEAELNRSLERSDPTFQEQKRRAARQLSNLAQRAATVDQSLLNATEQAIGWANEAEARPKLAEAREELRKAVQEASQMGGENALLAEMQQTAKEMSDALQTANNALDEVQKQTDSAAEKDIHQDDKARQQAKQRIEAFERTARDQRIRAADSEKRNWAAAEREAGQRVQASQRQQRSLETAQKRLDDQVKRQPNNSESLKQQSAALQKQIDDAKKAENAARETKEIAAQEAKEAGERSSQISKQKLPPLDKVNPAAQLASRMTEQAGDELTAIRKELAELSDAANIQDQLRATPAQTNQLAQQQQRIQQNVADAAEQLQRAARHEQRLGADEMAEALEKAAEMIAEGAMKATEQASQSLQAAADDSGKSPAANQDVAKATEQIRAAAEQLSAIAAAAEANPATSQQQEPASENVAEAQQKARTLDELDREINQSQPQDGSQPGEQQASQQSSSEGQPQDGSQPGEQPGQQTAADASPTLAGAMNSLAQQAARQRQQQTSPSSPANQPAEGSEQANSGTTPASEPGSGQMPDGGPVDTSDVQRLGSDWGQLRERRTEDAIEGRQTTVAPQYRREIEAYFRAIARRAAEKAK